MFRMLAAVLILGCSSTSVTRFAPLEGTGGSAGSTGAEDSGPVEAAAGAGGSGSRSHFSDAGPDAPVEADGSTDAAIDAAPIDPCPAGSIPGHLSTAEIRERDPRYGCTAQHDDGGFASWPEDGGMPGNVCCTQRSAWAGDVGCGEKGTLLTEMPGAGCDLTGFRLGNGVEAVRCCE